eukprot:904017-Prorocentrum_minimum.AAC.1
MMAVVGYSVANAVKRSHTSSSSTSVRHSSPSASDGSITAVGMWRTLRQKCDAAAKSELPGASEVGWASCGSR